MLQLHSFANVATLEHDQIQLILEHLSSETVRKVKAAQRTLYADHSARKVLGSGATVTGTVNLYEEALEQFLKNAVDDALEVAPDLMAFDLIVSALAAIFESLEPALSDAVRVSTRGGGPRFASAENAANNLFAEMKARIVRQLEIQKFAFAKPIAPRADAPALPVSGFERVPAVAPAKRNTGGKPLGEHWDKMWAAIAVKLWMGDLKPKSQKDVKAAMVDWFNQAEIDVGDTALTQRARQLWQAMQDAEG